MNRSLKILIGVSAVVVVAVAGWYFASPLFIDNVVDEAFPFEMPAADAMAAMTAAEKTALENDFMAAMPATDTLAEMSADERAQVEQAVLDAAAVAMQDKMIADNMPADADAWLVAAEGMFQDADDFHRGAGLATIFQQGPERVLRFEDFSVTNGPDLHVILARHPNPTSRADIGEDYIDLGSLKGNMGNQNYEIDADLDLTGYNSIIIYCVPFHVIFATAPLNPG